MEQSAFKKYIKEMYGLDDLKLESPQEIHAFLNRSENDLAVNQHEAEKILKKWKLIGTFQYQTNTFKIFKYLEDGYTFISLLSNSQPPYIILSQSFKEHKLKNKLGILQFDIWSDKIRTRGLARAWIFDFILKKYNFIMSDRNHTPEGKSFWIKLIIEALERNLFISVYHHVTNEFIPITNIDELKQYYGGLDKAVYQFIISKVDFNKSTTKPSVRKNRKS